MDAEITPSSRILLTKDEAAQELRTTVHRVGRWARAGILAHVVLPDSEIRFRLSDLQAFADAHLVGCLSEVAKN